MNVLHTWEIENDPFIVANENNRAIIERCVVMSNGLEKFWLFIEAANILNHIELACTIPKFFDANESRGKVFWQSQKRWHFIRQTNDVEVFWITTASAKQRWRTGALGEVHSFEFGIELQGQWWDKSLKMRYVPRSQNQVIRALKAADYRPIC